MCVSRVPYNYHEGEETNVNKAEEKARKEEENVKKTRNYGEQKTPEKHFGQ
jgi:hypothetical protein